MLGVAQPLAFKVEGTAIGSGDSPQKYCENCKPRKAISKIRVNNGRIFGAIFNALDFKNLGGGGALVP